MGADVYDPNDADGGTPVADRYEAVRTGDGALVVFDDEAEDAWIQSTTASRLSDRR